jgi:nucleotidyltransferase/DNA polymerase involved in DNA repair
VHDEDGNPEYNAPPPRLVNANRANRAFKHDLPVRRLSGVGGKIEEKLAALGVRTCGDLQQISKLTLAGRFGKWGLELFEAWARGGGQAVRLVGLGVRLVDEPPANQLDLGFG